jgi:hypothetical protein
MILLTILVLLFAGCVYCYCEDSKNRLDAWKSYALALEVENDCIEDYFLEPDSEGCGTRAKRRNALAQQRMNAINAKYVALRQLTSLGEYDD